MVRFHQAWRLPQPFGELAEEEDEPMRPYPEILQRRVGLPDSALRDAAGHEHLGRIGVPVLSPYPNRDEQGQTGCEENTLRHRQAISRRLRWAASALLAFLAVGCDEITIPTNTNLSGSELLFLAMQAGAPPPSPSSFYVVNSRSVVQRVLHPDAFNSLYVEIRFPAGALAALNGTPLGSGDSVQVTVEPAPGGYGLTVRPAGLDFTSGGSPTVTFSFAAYGDLSAADGSPTYASRLDYAEALTLWEDVGIDRWQRVSGSGSTGTDAVSGRLPAPGTYRVAAPR